MPQPQHSVNPAALLQTNTSTPQLSSRTLPSLSTAQKKPVQTAPRVDVEPLYTSLKNVIPEHWTAYKDAISSFVLGFLTLDELSRSIDHFICTDASRIHLHNQLLCGIYINIQREAPEQAVASWVSANDKPTSLAKPLSGDAAEQRLKYEVMQLPPRTRHRLKSIQDEPYAPITHSLLLTKDAKWIHNPTAPSSHLSAGGSAAGSSASGSGGGGSGGNNASSSGAAAAAAAANSAASASGASAGAAAGASGLNKELEIRKKFTLSLSTETRDIPGLSSLTERLVPTCYEEGLPSGPDAPEVIAELLSTAMEAFVKETITRIVGRSRVNGPLSGPESESSSMFVPPPPPATAATAATTTATTTTTVPPPPPSRTATPSGMILSNGGATTMNGATLPTSSSTSTGISLTNGNGDTAALPSADSSQPAAATTASPLLSQNSQQQQQQQQQPQAPPQPSRAAAVAAAAAAGLGASTIATIGVATRAYKKKIEKEEAAAAKGDLKRSDMGLLPVEVAALREPRTGRNMRGDIGLAWELGDAWLGGMMPWLGEKVVLNEFAEFEAARAHYGGGGDGVSIAGAGASAGAAGGGGGGGGGIRGAAKNVSGVNINGGSSAAAVKVGSSGSSNNRVAAEAAGGGLGTAMMAAAREGGAVAADAGGDVSNMMRMMIDPDDDTMVIDDPDNNSAWTWVGAHRDDRRTLGSVLDDCLSIGL